MGYNISYGKLQGATTEAVFVGRCDQRRLIDMAEKARLR